MKNWKDFDWTDDKGNTLPTSYVFASVDNDGCAYAYSVKPTIHVAVGRFINYEKYAICGEYQVDNWQESLIERGDYEKESNKSAFTEENFKKWIDDINGRHPFGYENEAKGVFDAFKSYLESRKQLPQEVTDAIAILEKHGYKFTKG